MDPYKKCYFIKKGIFLLYHSTVPFVASLELHSCLGHAQGFLELWLEAYVVGLSYGEEVVAYFVFAFEFVQAGS